ncbi:MAG TPA: PAS domain S-box protein, partial [Tepidisphaeraceae bacterium]|nr:PAS domain S-box protein [Tepidisphaeraceae bacterium]
PDSMVYQYTYDLDGSRRFLYISSGVERINGVTVADVLRDPGCLHRQVDPEQLPALFEAERVSGRDLTDFAMDVRMCRPDGQWRWMQLRSRPRRQSDGSVIWNGVQTDITERKHMEAALRESEEKFRTMAENARAVVGVVQGKRFVYANPYLAEISGYTVDEILAMDFVEMVHADFRERVVEYARRRQLGEAAPSHYEFAMITKSGQTRWMDFSPGRSAYHGKPAIVGIAYDVTARKQAEESLRENEARLRLAQEAGRVGTFEWDLHTNEVRWTPELESLYGLPSGGFSGRYEDWLKMLHPEDLAESERILREGIERGAMESEFRVVWPDGTVRWLSGRGQVIRDEAGRAVRLIGVNIDVTERKQAEQLLAAAKHSAERAKQVAEEASAAKDHFLAVLSHELRNPLTPVLPALTALERLVAEEGAEYLEVARRNVELEARLIDDLLDVTRIARGKVELHKQDIELCAVIRSAVEVCKSDLEARGLHFAMELDAGASCHVHGDAARLQQVFWNLLKNAIKFTPPGGCVGIRCWQEDRRAMTQIVDSGVGIAPEAMGRIFNAFEQETRSITRQFGGLGLGLAISRALVEMHGGSIGASSAGRGKGATFTVELPIVDSQLLEKPSTPAVNTQSCGRDRKLRILLVEDHGDTARILSRLLASEGHAVRHAGDVATAMKLAREEEFDVLLSDLGLPDGSGHDLMRQLIASGKHLPGIALSGFGMASDVKQSREAGFLEHVTKPVNFETLSAALNRAACAQRSLEGGVSVGFVQERGRSAG